MPGVGGRVLPLGSAFERNISCPRDWHSALFYNALVKTPLPLVLQPRPVSARSGLKVNLSQSLHELELVRLDNNNDVRSTSPSWSALCGLVQCKPRALRQLGVWKLTIHWLSDFN